MSFVKCIRCGNFGSWITEVENSDGTVRQVRRSSPFKAINRTGETEYIHWACLKQNEL